MLRLFRTLAILLLCCASAAAQRIQTMMIPAGTSVRFSSAASSLGNTISNAAGEVIRAFCIDRGRETPYTGASFNSLAGMVRIRLNDGSSKVMSFAEAGSYVEVTGAGTYAAVRIQPKRPDVVGVDFLEHGIATDGNRAEAAQSKTLVDRVFANGIKPTDTPRTVWDAFWKKSIIGRGKEKTTRLEYLRRDPQSTLRQEVLNLGGQGDSILLSLPGGSTVLIDTGLTTEAFDRIKAKLPGHDLYAIVTHPDKDHAGNMAKLASSQSFSQIAISSWDTRADFLRKLRSDLSSKFAEEAQDQSPMALYRSAPANAPPPPPIIRPRTLVAGMPDDDLPIAMYTMRLEDGVDIELFQSKDPKTSNDSSIATRVTHNGYTTLYAADITPRAMAGILATELVQEATVRADFIVDLLHKDYPLHAAVMDRKYGTDLGLNRLTAETRKRYLEETLDFLVPQYSRTDLADQFEAFILANEHRFVTLHADNLKWPHHAWLPSKKKDRELLAAFVEKVNPKRIIFSVGPNDISGQSVSNVIQFLKQMFPNKKFEFFVTRNDGNIQILSQNLLNLIKHLATAGYGC